MHANVVNRNFIFITNFIDICVRVKSFQRNLTRRRRKLFIIIKHLQYNQTSKQIHDSNTNFVRDVTSR